MSEWCIKMMRSAEKWQDAKNYAIMAGYDVGKLLQERYINEF
ncbi:hypothetical protein NVP1039O_33 [Vibrio phage 1.039.O._10N.286.55.A2]|nr:hypothetical protein NVP1036O_33 [Vibrio phage 1.036.O._10N.286.45.C3]AUR83732.1 hypothetical protein NVP1039O_33 [Vibrio phage 1.039.O._10N.286.55.A2]AUR84612.1 hypothetical protein NVP1061O_31 [Vibrio phage 1.061.O._10N.286.55.C2]AUR85053.1 hypothetical protein NVP1067O_41 [Vibrio phage 1.067.O._10N.261.52.C9]AUR85287.1 hypothetical protein NVP1071A_57 [Vibrio phage 1.071.A._10N.286.46.A12]AUR86870.1 hypothetical protein NVP1090B_35 [Vibrio phage 1.090.B._10N.286.48.F1]